MRMTISSASHQCVVLWCALSLVHACLASLGFTRLRRLHYKNERADWRVLCSKTLGCTTSRRLPSSCAPVPSPLYYICIM